MKKILLIVTLFFVKAGVAQQNDSANPDGTTLQTASVIIHKDPRIDLLVKKKAAINKNAKKSVARTGRGYRLLILSTNNREEAIDAKTKVYTYFPDLKVYLSYQTPFFKLKAGNFQTRAEAERYRKNMATLFPGGVFIINDTIEIKAEKTTTEE
ncbi:MAG: SPOR domain-containing protein [Flavisolibacter sp.]|nr:SPOR domain-containing protein [Flavisolibacter sp.]